MVKEKLIYTEVTGRRKWMCSMGGILLGSYFLPVKSQAAPSWPSKPVQLIIPSAAGSPWDPIARYLAEELSKEFNQPFVVINKSGATGLIGMEQLANTTDGHALAVMFMPHTILPALHKKMPYDTLSDLVPVAQTQWTYNVLVVRPSLGVTTMQELIALAKKNPGKLSFASGGNGTPAHLMGEYFKQITQTDILHVPYRGPVAAIQDLVGDRTDLSFVSVAAAVPHIQNNRLLALAVTSKETLDVMPNVPTFEQIGFSDFDVRDWAGIVAPKSLPKEAIEVLNTAIIKALASESIQQKFAGMGVYLHTSTAQEFQSLIRSEIPKWEKIINQAGIKID